MLVRVSDATDASDPLLWRRDLEPSSLSGTPPNCPPVSVDTPARLGAVRLGCSYSLCPLRRSRRSRRATLTRHRRAHPRQPVLPVAALCGAAPGVAGDAAEEKELLPVEALGDRCLHELQGILDPGQRVQALLRLFWLRSHAHLCARFLTATQTPARPCSAQALTSRAYVMVTWDPFFFGGCLPIMLIVLPNMLPSPAMLPIMLPIVLAPRSDFFSPPLIPATALTSSSCSSRL